MNRRDQPLFDARTVGTRRGRVGTGLERSLRALRQAHALEPADAVRLAVMRTLAEIIDADARRPDTSSYSLATAGRTLVDLFNQVAGQGAPPDALDDLVALMSAPAGDTPPP